MSKSRRSGSGPTSRATGPAAASASLDPIAIGLQHLFASVADEPIPDEFLKLLDRIEAGEQARRAGKPVLDGVDKTTADGAAAGGKADGAAAGEEADDAE